MAYVPDIPDQLPSSHIYVDGDDGVTVDWRIREHWSPSPVWRGMMTTQSREIMSFPDTNYPKNTPSRLHHLHVNRHVRQYASSFGLNANDEDHTNVTSYWTRVERVEKLPNSEKRWTVTLRKLTPLRNGTLEVRWWQEEFDAIVIGNTSEYEAAWVPPIPGLDELANLRPDDVFHSRQYRHPQDFAEKNVLVLGGGLSGVGIANDLVGHAQSVTISARKVQWNPVVANARGSLHPNITIVPEVKRFHTGKLPSSHISLQNTSLVLANGTAVTGFDTVRINIAQFDRET
ncbi:hypothetical protein DL93DRAFT_2084634 [Clavulina sp. PMI_390]|nr:hypothetical protein DL93DRAFT_2084634 [Clavulina sp. PMI_390]